MPDFIDHASSNEAKFTEMAIASQRKRSVQTSEQESAQECHECGDEIPELRRIKVAGCKYCVSCQQLAEKGLI
ncbi:Molecular chaperone DnaK [Vibrio crassostreae]|uniref:TraR/DksA C4-type zinc finger protein n=1 Tax=Vibrio TaxID=662 RepID=UPI000C8486AE|nr:MULTISPECIES: TraR/DksA C4-type zinc finger protein [Vibrio]PMI63308.1 molecular chaperone DnaK [Vibrio lentus]PMJ62024.1 molecular chaperone DnaK [Vibrio lentus]ROO65751.1 TraR/DksA family transcriptional regulator [Vibrio crassostreae]CAK3479082.1 Molecular chaperone DnaK [Vibrio crassostreae]CAK3612372.1 Molecular chaperone DnaK [Vibrio crassostreae]